MKELSFTRCFAKTVYIALVACRIFLSHTYGLGQVEVVAWLCCRWDVVMMERRSKCSGIVRV